MRKFYSKELPESPVYVAGHPLVFDFLETEDAALIEELDKCIARHVGGVVSITEDQFREEVKKKENGSPSAASLRPKLQRTELQAIQWDVLRAAAGTGHVSQFAKVQADRRPHARHGLPNPMGPSATDKMPDPLEVPTAESFGDIVRPPTAKARDMA